MTSYKDVADFSHILFYIWSLYEYICVSLLRFAAMSVEYNIKMMRRFVYFIAALIFVAISCSEPIVVEEPKPSIILAEGQKIEMDVDPEGEVARIKFHSTLDWTAQITNEADWASIIPASGKGGDVTCKIKVEKNLSGSKRNVIISIVSHESNRKFKLNQKALDSMTGEDEEDGIEDGPNDNSDNNTGDSSGEDPGDNNGTDGDSNGSSGDDDNVNDGNEDDNGSGDDDSTGDNTGDNAGDNTEENEGTSAQSGKYGWYELPQFTYTQSGRYMIDTDDNELYYAHHICAGNEKGPNGKTARNYTVCFSAEHHCPVWVAAPRHTMYQSGASRTDAYSADPDIPSDIQYNSKSTGGGCNKGHMLGSAERLSSTETNKQVFYYSNIAPQYSDTFNTGGGGWNILEDWVDGQVCKDTLYVVIGAYFDKYTDRRGHTGSPAKISFGGRNDVSRPTMFYYILMRTKSGSSGKALKDCSASEIKCAAFVRSHETPKGTNVSEKDLMSVSDLEKITGFTYFPNVPNAPKSSYNASDWGL
jgi:DNA/RNA endonuclease G (NUC1)